MMFEIFMVTRSKTSKSFGLPDWKEVILLQNWKAKEDQKRQQDDDTQLKKIFFIALFIHVLSNTEL